MGDVAARVYTSRARPPGCLPSRELVERPSFVRTLAALVPLVVLVAPAVAGAQDVTFDEAIGLAAGAPWARAPRRALEARRQGDRDLGGASQGLSIQATPGARVRSEADRGFEGQVTVVHSWNLGGLGRARRGAARAERDVLAAEARVAALASKLEAARLWIDLHRLLALEALLAEEESMAGRLVEVTGRALRAGAGTRADAAEAEAYAADVALRAVGVEGLRHERSVALAVAMGRVPLATLRSVGALPAPALPDDEGQSLARAARLPEVVAARLEATAERARAAEASAAFAASLGIGAQLMRESPDGIVAQGVLTLGVPIGDPGRRARSVALGEAARRESEAERAQGEAARALALAFHEVAHARREEGLVTERLIPALDALVAQRDAALAAGEATVFELLDARRRLVAARMRALEVRAARAWAEVRLWLLLAELERGDGGSR